MYSSTKLPLILIALLLSSALPALEAYDASGDTPALLSPPNGSLCVDMPPTLDWGEVTGARCYQVQIGTICDEGTKYAIMESERLIADLDPNVQYYWRVRARLEEWGPWSECWTFGPRLFDPPETPIPLSPAHGATDVPTEFTVEWQCAAGAASYDLRVGSSCGAGSQYSSTTCSKTLSNLESGRSYWWRVRGRNVCDLPGQWSDCQYFSTAGYALNSEGKWLLHFGGPHNSKADTRSFEISSCDDVVVDAPSSPGRYDVYVVAADVDRIAGTRYGLECDGEFLFYGWITNSDLEIPTAGWPGCGEGIAQVWSVQRTGPYVLLGILDMYVYGSSTSLRVGDDPRVGFGEWCDGTVPRPICLQTRIPEAFGAIGFGVPGDNPCAVTPARLGAVVATASKRGILLEWSSAGVGDFSHFYVHRSASGRDGDYLMLSGIPTEADNPGGWGYSYLDEDVIPGTLYFYKLEGVENHGVSLFFGPYEAKAADFRAEYRLYQNVPNPLTGGGSTTIRFSVVEAGRVSVRILDAAGRLVKGLEITARPGGNSLTWDGTDNSGGRVSSGVYFYEINAGTFSAERKMLVVE